MEQKGGEEDRQVRVVKKIDECVGEFIVTATFRNVDDHSTWAFMGVYGPNSDRDGRIFFG